MFKKMITGVFCSLLLAMMVTSAHAASMVTIYLREVDPYGLEVNNHGTSNPIVNTYAYANYGTCQNWSGPGTLVSGLTGWQNGRFDRVQPGTYTWTHQDRFCQPWNVSHRVSGTYTAENTTLTKSYSNITAVNPDGTPYTGSITQKIYVGRSGLTTLGYITAPDTTAACGKYVSQGYTTWLVPRIWNGGGTNYSIYLVDGQNWIEYTYSSLGAYTNAPWDLPLTFSTATTRGGNAKSAATINKNVKGTQTRKNMKFRNPAPAKKIEPEK